MPKQTLAFVSERICSVPQIESLCGTPHDDRMALREHRRETSVSGDSVRLKSRDGPRSTSSHPPRAGPGRGALVDDTSDQRPLPAANGVVKYWVIASGNATTTTLYLQWLPLH
jgi:hypothetical protein